MENQRILSEDPRHRFTSDPDVVRHATVGNVLLFVRRIATQSGLAAYGVFCLAYNDWAGQWKLINGGGAYTERQARAAFDRLTNSIVRYDWSVGDLVLTAD